MTMKPDILYVPYCFDGTAARKVQPKCTPVQQAVVRPQVHRRRRKKTVIRLDPVAALATLVACVMLVSMAVGLARLDSIQDQTQQYESYTATLEAKGAQLQAEYYENYDAEDVRQKALAMGMVPRENIQQVTIQVQQPVEEAQPGFWEQVGTFLAGLFA